MSIGSLHKIAYGVARAKEGGRSTDQHNYNNTNSHHLPDCGIANVRQFSMIQNNQIWFTEWSENKISASYMQISRLPFSIMTSQKELTVKSGRKC